ncbi:MAG: NAD(P)H-dependent glycerol-3-phosphate dehydrogenase [Actinomycetia bacterium]|nr:NAD(P)H-dependent glycerol-3-phosphate dehydrogenase [Actinomycetes bacterium]
MRRIRVAVTGGGSWGTTVAHLVAHNVPTMLWARDPETVDQINTEQMNGRYLDGHQLHPELRATSSLEEAISGADLLVMGVPSKAFRETLEKIEPHLRPWVPVVSLSKGLELSTSKRMTQVINEVLPGHPVGVLTGPNLAKEILAGDAAASALAMSEDHIAEELRSVFGSPTFRVYTNSDVVGCEVAGALKNVVAIAAGMADGLGAGDNTKATIITRGLAELTRLGVKLGGAPLTFSGLAGMGDLIATCMSTQSRNRHVGERMGLGLTVDEVVAEMNQVAEGIKTTKVAFDLARELEVEMPITAQMYKACHKGRTAHDCYEGLLRPDRPRELHGIE